MNKMLTQVRDFYIMCRAEDQMMSAPTAEITKKVKDIRIKLIREEFDELIKAMEENDLVEIADALGDLLYVVIGTVLAYGLQYKMLMIFDEIHRSNMTKAGKDGKCLMREDGKILKPEWWEPPKIKEILDYTDKTTNG